MLKVIVKEVPQENLNNTVQMSSKLTYAADKD